MGLYLLKTGSEGFVKYLTRRREFQIVLTVDFLAVDQWLKAFIPIFSVLNTSDSFYDLKD